MSTVVYDTSLAVLNIVQPLLNVYTGFGFILTILCAAVIAPAASPVLVPKYKDLDKHKKAYLDTLLGSTIHAVSVSFLTVYVLLFDQLRNEYIFSESILAMVILQFSIGYFCADMILIMLDNKMRREKMSVLHHFLGAYGIWLGLTHNGVAVYWVVYRLFTESSTPFVNCLHWMNAIGYPKKSPLFITNSLMLTAVFYLCRIAIIPYHWYALYNYVYIDPSMAVLWPPLIQYWMVVTYTLLDALNIIWAYKLTKGGYRILKQLWKASD